MKKLFFVLLTAIIVLPLFSNAQTAQPTASIFVSPTIAFDGETVKVTWSSTNAESCTGLNFSTGNATSGSLIVTPFPVGTSPSIYGKYFRVSCTNSIGQTTYSSQPYVGRRYIRLSSPIAGDLLSATTSPFTVRWYSNMNVSSTTISIIARQHDMGDINDDGKVSIADFLTLSSSYNSTIGSAKYIAAADLNSDGQIGFADYLTLSQNYNKSSDLVLAKNLPNTPNIGSAGGLDFSKILPSRVKFLIKAVTDGKEVSHLTENGYVKILSTAQSPIAVTNASSVPPQNIAINMANQPLGGFTTTVQGEPVVANTLNFQLATSSSGTKGPITNVTIVDQNGLVVAGPVDQNLNTGSSNKISFSDAVVFPVGTRTYTVKGKIPSTWSGGSTVTLHTDPRVQWGTLTGQTTGKPIIPALGSVAMSTMTVKGATLVINVSSSPVSQTVVAGANAFTFANYILDASTSGEDIRMNSLPVEYNAGYKPYNLTNCQLYSGSTSLTTGSNVKDPIAAASSTLFYFDAPLAIAKGTFKTLTLKCNIASGASGTYSWGYDSSASPFATGVTTGQSVAITEIDSPGQRMIVTSSGGSFSITTDSSSPAFRLVSGGSQNVEIGTMRLTATNESYLLQTVGLHLASGRASDLALVSVWDGTSKVGEAVLTGTSTSATATMRSNIIIPQNGIKLLTLKADFSAIGSAKPGTSGDLVVVNVNPGQIQTMATGFASGQTVSGSGGTNFQGVRTFKSIPVAETISLPSSILVSGRQAVSRFKISSIGSNVKIGKISFSLSKVGNVNIQNMNVYAFTDAQYSIPVTTVNPDGRISVYSTSPDFSSSTSATIRVQASNSLGNSAFVNVSANTPIYFELRGDITNPTGASIATRIMGDTGLVSLPNTIGTFVEVNSQKNNRFIWSPDTNGNTNSNTLSGTSDWTNGFGVSGLPSAGTQSQILTAQASNSSIFAGEYDGLENLAVEESITAPSRRFALEQIAGALRSIQD